MSAFICLIIYILYYVNNAQIVTLWNDTLDSYPSDWDTINTELESTTNCPSSNTCWNIKGSKGEISRMFSAIGYGFMNVTFGINTNIDAQDVCEIYYKLGSTSYLMKQFDYTTTSKPFISLSIPSTANNRADIGIQFLNTGKQFNSDSCYIDNVEVIGSVIPYNATTSVPVATTTTNIDTSPIITSNTATLINPTTRVPIATTTTNIIDTSATITIITSNAATLINISDDNAPIITTKTATIINKETEITANITTIINNTDDIQNEGIQNMDMSTNEIITGAIGWFILASCLIGICCICPLLVIISQCIKDMVVDVCGVDTDGIVTEKNISKTRTKNGGYTYTYYVYYKYTANTETEDRIDNTQVIQSAFELINIGDKVGIKYLSQCPSYTKLTNTLCSYVWYMCAFIIMTGIIVGVLIFMKVVWESMGVAMIIFIVSVIIAVLCLLGIKFGYGRKVETTKNVEETDNNSV